MVRAIAEAKVRYIKKITNAQMNSGGAGWTSP